jgi:Zn finger protein HypA/HybF involved in hydrogenase expression
MKKEYGTRCNNCMKYFESDEELQIIYKEGEYVSCCPNCKTDEYLMDLDKDI